MAWLLQQNEKTIRAFTGLPPMGLSILLKYYDEICSECFCKFSLPPREILLLTLFFAKQSPTYEVLQALFNVSSTSVVSRILHAAIPIINEMVRAILRRHPPNTRPIQRIPQLETDEFKNVKLIADCTLIRIEKPRHPDLNKATYSAYMTAHMGKVLVYCDAAGTIVDVSLVYGGNATDDDIILHDRNGALLALLQDGDALMYDKGATKIVAEALAAKGVTLIKPPTVHKGHLSSSESEASKRISVARVIIENLNERARRFRILSGPIPCGLFGLLEDIVAMCYFLTIFMGPIRKDGGADGKDGGADDEEEEIQVRTGEDEDSSEE